MTDNYTRHLEERIKELEEELRLTKKALQGRGAQKLTEEKVREIIKLREEGRTYVSIAKQFGISISSVYGISRRKQWRHVTHRHTKESAK